MANRMTEAAKAHQILSQASDRPVRVGEQVEVSLTRAVLSGARVPATLVRTRKEGKPWSPDDLILAMDFQAPEVESEIPRSRALCRDFAEEYGLRNVFDLNMGIGSHVVVESTQITPGQLIVGCGRCLGVVGGIGALPLRLEEADLARAIVTGKTSITVPPCVRVEVVGRLPRQAGPLDVAFAVSRVLGPSLGGRMVEFHGDAHLWGVDLRVGLCGLLMEMGALAAMVPVDEIVAKFYKERGKDIDPRADGESDGGFETEVTVNAQEVESVTALDYAGSCRSLAASDNTSIHGVFAGSCYGGRYDDLALVAEVLKKEGRVHPDVRLVISPATLETAQACLAAGFYETFLSAGAMVVVPGGGPGSAGGGAIFGEGERIASTAEYHRALEPGQGLPEVHLLSPAAAAVAATKGRLLDPSESLA